MSRITSIVLFFALSVASANSQAADLPSFVRGQHQNSFVFFNCDKDTEQGYVRCSMTSLTVEPVARQSDASTIDERSLDWKRDPPLDILCRQASVLLKAIDESAPPENEKVAQFRNDWRNKPQRE